MKGIHILLSALILGASWIIGVIVHAHLTRFIAVDSSKDGVVYVIDRSSGDAVAMKGGERFPVTDFEPRSR